MSAALSTFFKELQCILHEYDEEAPTPQEADNEDDDASTSHRSTGTSKSVSISAFQVTIMSDNATSALQRITTPTPPPADQSPGIKNNKTVFRRAERRHSTPLFSGSLLPYEGVPTKLNSSFSDFENSQVRNSSRWQERRSNSMDMVTNPGRDVLLKPVCRWESGADVTNATDQSLKRISLVQPIRRVSAEKDIKRLHPQPVVRRNAIVSRRGTFLLLPGVAEHNDHTTSNSAAAIVAAARAQK